MELSLLASFRRAPPHDGSLQNQTSTADSQGATMPMYNHTPPPKSGSHQVPSNAVVIFGERALAQCIQMHTRNEVMLEQNNRIMGYSPRWEAQKAASFDTSIDLGQIHQNNHASLFVHALVFECPACNLPVVVGRVSPYGGRAAISHEAQNVTCPFCEDSFRVIVASSREHYIAVWKENVLPILLQ